VSQQPYVLYSICHRFIHQEGMWLLKIVAKSTVEGWKINDEGILNYFTHCLSCVLQKANMIDAINDNII
jgi:hypothetical protein